MKMASGVDDDRLACHGLGAAHRHHHIGSVILVGGLLQRRAGRCACRQKVGCRPRAFQQSGRHAGDERFGRQCHRHAAREVEARVRHCIGNGRARRPESRHGCDVDNAAASCAVMTGATALVRRIGPVRLTAMILSHTSCVSDHLVVGGVVDQDVDASEGGGGSESASRRPRHL